MTKEKVVDILDQVKRSEKVIKQHLLIKKLSTIKKYAREIHELKEKCSVELEEIGVGAEDIKRVIDFVNELSEVKLTEADKKEIQERIKRDVKNERQEVEKEVVKIASTLQNEYYSFLSPANSATTLTTTGSNVYIGTGGAVGLMNYTTGALTQLNI